MCIAIGGLELILTLDIDPQLDKPAETVHATYCIPLRGIP